MTSATPYVGVLLEQTLGHVSHGRNLCQTFAQVDGAEVAWRELPFEPNATHHRVPPFSNWTVRSSMAAQRAVRSLEQHRPLDALIVHTHVPATLLGQTMTRVPTVVSIDATPAQIDQFGAYYDHEVKPGPVERAKHRLHVRCFQQARSLVTWSQWAANSLIADYDVDGDKITVIPPGVTREQWLRPEPRTDDGPLRILFVGGDFIRKGGDLLVEAVERLRRDPDVLATGRDIELHLVTSPSAPVEAAPHRHVHHGLTPNSPELIELFHRCDVFALPTRGDCTPVVLAEAASAGLPAVATDVGAVAESVVDGITGHIVEPDAESVAAGLRPLLLDAEHRRRLGENAVGHATNRMDSDTNARRLLDVALEATESEPTRRVALTVSGVVPAGIEDSIAAGVRPLADYQAIAGAAEAELVDWTTIREDESRVAGLVRRVAGNSVALAYHLYRNRKDYDAVITDGEQVGLPLAAMLRFGGGKPFQHVMIGHRLSPTKKALPIRLLGLSKGVDDVLLYATSQARLARKLFSLDAGRIHRIDFMVDSEFFRAERSVATGPVGHRPLICAAGREFRDYPTLIEAVRGLDADVIIASASPWSKRADNAGSVDDTPDNVRVTALSQRELRDLLEDVDLLVMPLQETDFQAGITSILEAMSMERPVVCSATEGQTDVVIEGTNGRLVPPGDASALRTAITEILADPEKAAAMGRNGRELVLDRADVRDYAQLIATITLSPGADPRARPVGPSGNGSTKGRGRRSRPHLGVVGDHKGAAADDPTSMALQFPGQHRKSG